MATADKSLKDKAVDIKGKDYVQVKDRIQYLSDNYDWRYSLESEYQYYPENRLWVVKSTLTIRDEKHEHCCVYTWLAQEIESDDYRKVNFSSALENAQTSAWGRAAAAWWCWITIDGWIASANEMQKAMNRAAAAKTEKEAKSWPFEEKQEEELDWFEKAKQWIKFMQNCLDEDDFINKIKTRVKEIWEKMTKQQESDLRICYKNAKAMEKFDTSILA